MTSILLAISALLLGAQGRSLRNEAPIARNPKRMIPKFRDLEYTPGVYNTKGGPVADKLNIHLVPHTHDDVGWLKTVDQYYYGSNNSIQTAAVQYILDSVISSLKENPDRKFIYVEAAFLKRWWDQQTAATKDVVRGFVNEGRLEFINGGWCMDDEAGPSFVDMIDQTTLGHQFLLKEFGAKGVPRVGWQIDPFGHSATQATLYALMGMDAWFAGRIDYQDRAYREAHSECEMVMRGSASLGRASDIFTGVTRNYGPPSGFDYDQNSRDPPIMDDPRLEDFNVDERVALFINRSLEQAEHYLTNNIMFTMGEDFNYANANTWFKNLDKLIHYVNMDGRVNAFYSTPSLYVKAKQEAAARTQVPFPTKTDDWFPYADATHAFWTGYFVSRPSLKGYARSMSSYLSICRQLEVLSPPKDRQTTNSMNMWDAVGISQHHDAIAGTEKQHVANDYAARLSRGAAACKKVVDSGLTGLVAPSLQMQWYECPLLNESKCGASTDGGSAAFVLYNSLPRSRTEYVRLPILAARSNGTVILDAKNNKVPFDLFPVPNDATLQTAVFQVAVPAMGFQTYFLVVPASETSGAAPLAAQVKPVVPNADTVIENDNLQLVFSGTSGRLVRITNKKSKVTTALEQYWTWYNSSDGNVAKDQNQGQASGAYIFRPNCTENVPQACEPFFVKDGKATITVRNGSNVVEVVQVFDTWVQQVIRLYKGQDSIEVEYTVGPIPWKDSLGREIVSIWRTDMNTAQTFYTDSNGRDMQQRKINFRPTWKLNVTDPVSGNFYPVNHAITIRDQANELAILTDRTQGGASLRNGELQIMVHRRTLKDDRRGVGEPINETGVDGNGLVIKAVHRVLFGPIAQAGAARRALQDRVAYPVNPSFTPFRGTVQDWVVTHHTSFTGLKQELPVNVHLLSLHDNSVLGTQGSLILRLSHQLEASEDANLSKPVTVKLTELFSTLSLSKCRETTVTGNQDLAAMDKPLEWITRNGKDQDLPEAQFQRVPFQADQVTINPMEIRTFICDYAPL